MNWCPHSQSQISRFIIGEGTSVNEDHFVITTIVKESNNSDKFGYSRMSLRRLQEVGGQVELCKGPKPSYKCPLLCIFVISLVFNTQRKCIM